jgi:hypothetical protein
MSVIRFTDMGVECNYDGCTEMCYGSQLGLGVGMTVTHVRTELAKRGWKTGVENTLFENEREIVRGERLDYCPRHRGDRSLLGMMAFRF